jgi:hydrogenase expression/formation protein HypE
MRFLKPGKLPPEVLQRMLNKIPSKDPRVVVGPRIGEDAAVLDMGDWYLVAKTDPITFTQERIGWYCVNVNANDIATMGAEPRWFLVTLLLPEGKTDTGLAESIFDDILSACSDLGISLCGGHTEITHDLKRPILIGQMLGEVEKDRLVDTRRIRPGDSILLTEGIAIEGTAILAHEMSETLSGIMSSDHIQKAKSFLNNPGISVVRAARIAGNTVQIHGMHDPTEGGLATGLWELAQVSGYGLRVDTEAVPIYPETEILCKTFRLDSLGLIASGTLLIVTAAEEGPIVVSALRKENIPCQKIGEVIEKGEPSTLVQRDIIRPLAPFLRDEIARVLC